MKTLYLDCFSGISGDMTIGALLDAGGDFSYLKEELQKLHIEEEYELKVSSINKNGIAATKFDVILTEEAEHHHRTYQSIVKLITTSELSGKVKEMSLKLFTKIGEAEGKIHGIPLEDVHFHEVGAVDSLIDIIGTAILLEDLQIDRIKSAPVPTGSGRIHIAHGIYPIPAPATLEILKGIPLAESELKAELTTPTGAAIAAVLAEEYRDFPAMKVESIGYGAGTKSFPKHPNVLRVVIGQ